MPTFSNTPRPAYVYEAATDQWIPVGFGPHTHAVTDVTNAFNTTTVTTKGDLVVAAGSNNITRLPAGSNGDTLVPDSSTTTGLRWQGSFAAGKNKVINGDFGVWQRGTSFSSDGYTSDRWRFSKNAGTTATISRQAFTAGSAPVAPYESQFFSRYQRTAGAFDDYFLQRVEDARTFAGVTSTFSFWAKASANTTISQIYAAQTTNGTGGAGAGAFGGVSITTSWARYTVSISLPALTGATFGAGNFVELVFKFGSEMGNITVDIWGAQWEAGSVATSFQTASGSIGGELALCMRYYQRQLTGGCRMGVGFASSTSAGAFVVHLPVAMRTGPSSIEYAGTIVWYDGVTGNGAGTLTLTNASPISAGLNMSGSSGLTQYRPYGLSGNSSDAYLAFNAEL
jgi:hypothetical protein